MEAIDRDIEDPLPEMTTKDLYDLEQALHHISKLRAESQMDMAFQPCD